MANLRTGSGVVNRLSNALRVEHMEKELVRPRDSGLSYYKPESLIVQKLVGLWHENGTAEQTGCLLVPVFMHALFNAWNVTVLTVLSSAS